MRPAANEPTVVPTIKATSSNPDPPGLIRKTNWCTNTGTSIDRAQLQQLGQERGNVSDFDDRQSEDARRENGCRGPPLLDQEGGQEHDRDDEPDCDRRRGPRERAADPTADHEEHGDGAREEAQAKNVDLGTSVTGRQIGQRAATEDQRERAQRQVDPKTPPPIEFDQKPAQRWSGDRRDRECGTDVRHVLRAFAGPHDVADHRLRENEDAARADALNGPRQDQLGHVLRERAQERGHDEDAQRDHDETATPVRVAKFAVDQRHRRRRHEIGHDHPRQTGDAVQVASDLRERRRNDRLIGRAEGDCQKGTAQKPECLALTTHTRPFASSSCRNPFTAVVGVLTGDQPYPR